MEQSGDGMKILPVDRIMTVRQLHARLGQIIADNDARGESERNDLPMLFRIHRGRRGNDWFIPIESVWSGELTIQLPSGIKVRCIHANGLESAAIKLGTRKRED